MKFKEIKEALVQADWEAIVDWNDLKGTPSIEQKLNFVEERQLLLAGAVMAILTELIAREET